MGARSCSLVLPRPSLLCRRLNFYVPGEHAPHPRMDGVTNVQFYAGAIPGEAPLSMKRRPEMCSFSISTGSSGSGAAHRCREKPRSTFLHTWGKLTCFKCLLQSAYVRTIPTSVASAFTRRRIKPSGYLTLPHLPFTRSPRLRWRALATAPPNRSDDHHPPKQAKLCPLPRPAGRAGSTGPPTTATARRSSETTAGPHA